MVTAPFNYPHHWVPVRVPDPSSDFHTQIRWQCHFCRADHSELATLENMNFCPERYRAAEKLEATK